ncbi:hypothetical protein DFP72DRAFT_1055766 [Ephemerocybe angulata]|uniref:F-box domain-containing protein n=1 Tax=Ephemerocybe angulata TaxID=980116 RepID=A0A8H6H602_9AGAR|nr:hypothetical protein DFP72DRAFT_1055766 [Tulosesus angulatus]
MASSASLAILDDDTLLSIFESIPALEHRIAKGWDGLRTVLPVSQLWRHHALMIPPSQRVAYEGEGRISGEASDIQADTRMVAAQHFRTELVRRSQTLSLDSGREWDVFDDYYPTPKQVLSVLAYAYRLRSCTLKLRCFDTPGIEGVTPSINASVLKALTQCSCPALEDLCVDISYDRLITYILPNTIFPGGLKSLTELRLRSCWMDLQALQLGAELEWLEVTIYTLLVPQAPAMQDFPSTFQILLDILSHVPNLRHLNLGYFPLFTLPVSAVISSPPVTLNRLSYLDMTLTAPELEVFVQQVSIPACQSIHLTVHLPTAAPKYMACIATLVARHVRPSRYGTQMTLFDCGDRQMGCATQPNDDEVDIGDPKVYLEGAFQYKVFIVLVPSNREEDIGSIFPNFLSAWNSILDGINALIVQQSTETPSYICRAINGFISIGRKHRMRTVVCSKDLVGVLVGDSVTAGGKDGDPVSEDSILNVIQVEERSVTTAAGGVRSVWTFCVDACMQCGAHGDLFVLWAIQVPGVL